MTDKKNIIAIIPARGDSKSIPKKNIKLLAGKPLIAYPIELAKSVPEIDRVIVSTDSEEIVAIAREYGAEVPFIRPAELALDETPTLPVLQHCVKYLEEKEGYKTDVIALLFPTNPLLNKEKLKEAIKKIIEENVNTVMVVEQDWGRYWSYDDNTKKYLPLYPKVRVNRQLYMPLLKEISAITLNSNFIMNGNKAVDEENISFIIENSGDVVDIDTTKDWAGAEKVIEKNKITYPELKENVVLGDTILINFINLNDAEKEMVRNWRNKDNIRKWMISDHIINKDEHSSFLQGLKSSSKHFYWVVKRNEDYIGVVSLMNVDFDHLRSSFGAYANPEKNIIGAGQLLFKQIIDVAFNKLNIHSIRGETMEENPILYLHKQFGFNVEGVWKDYLFKDGKWKNMVLTSLIKKENGANI